MKLKSIFKGISKYVVKHSPNILTILNITGVASTGILAAKEGAIAHERLEDLSEECQRRFEEGLRDSLDLSAMEKVKATLPIFAPAILVGSTTIGCAIGANRISNHRNAVIASLYSASELAANEYHDKVVELLGEKKEKEIRDAVAKDRIDAAPVSSSQVVIVGDGDHLCFDVWSGRYFKSNIEKVRKVGNWAIEQLKREMELTVNELYYELGLDPIGNGRWCGWEIDDISLKDDFFDFSSQIADNGEPCLVIDFHVMPDMRV